MSACRDIRGLLALRPLDRSAEEQMQVEAHLAACPDCTALARAYAEQDLRLRDTRPVSLTPAQRDQLLSRISSGRRRHVRRTKLFSIFGPATFVAALVAMVLGLNQLFRQHLQTATPPAPDPARSNATPQPSTETGFDCTGFYPGLPVCLRDEPLVGGRLAFVDDGDPFDGRPAVIDLERGSVWPFEQGAGSLRGWSPSGDYLLTAQSVHQYDGQLVSLDVLPFAFWAPPDAVPDAHPAAHDWLTHATADGALEAIPFPLDEPPRQILLPGSLGDDGRAIIRWAPYGALAWSLSADQLAAAGQAEQTLYVRQAVFGAEDPTSWLLSGFFFETYYQLIDWAPGTPLVLAGRGAAGASIWADGVPLVAIDTTTGEVTDLAAWMLLTGEAYDWHPTQPGLLALAEGGGRFLTDPPKRLMLLDLTTGQSRTLTGEDVVAFEPAWSPDGSLLAYAAVPALPGAFGDGTTMEDRLAGRAIYVVNPATGESRVLTEPGSGIDGWPQWSADGTLLLYTRQSDGATDVRVVALDGNSDDLLITGLPDPMCYYGGCNWQQMLAYHPGP